MFRNIITSTPFSGEEVGRAFKIDGDSYGVDVTFLSTLRALVAPRKKDTEEINLYFRNLSYSASTIARNAADAVLKAMYDQRLHTNGSIVICDFNMSIPEDSKACMTVVKSTFTQVYPDWQQLEIITEFFQKNFYSLCYINPEKHKVVIFTEGLNVRRMHYLQCAIFAFLPWYFNPKDGVSADEMELIKSLQERTPDKYEAAIAKLAKLYDFRGMRIRNELAGFETKWEKLKLQEVISSNRATLDFIDRRQAEISEALKKKRDLDIQILGLKEKIASENPEDSEIMQFFLVNKKLGLVRINDSTLQFVVASHLRYVDDEKVKAFLKNKHSCIYTEQRGSIEREDMGKLIKAIFVDNELQVRICAAYEFHLGVNVEGLSSFCFGSEYDTYMPNPHIWEYHCLGDYAVPINQCIKDSNYVGAITQCIASCESLNLTDPSMNHFMRYLYDYADKPSKKVIELPDGTIMNVSEAIAWVKAKEEGGTTDGEVA